VIQRALGSDHLAGWLFVLPAVVLIGVFGILPIGWALLTSLAFSAWHYIGPLGDPFEAQPFIFRWVCGTVFVAIYALRGFAPAVWTHAVYDLWVMLF